MMKKLIQAAKDADADSKWCWGMYLDRVKDLNDPAQQSVAQIPCLLASAGEWYGRWRKAEHARAEAWEQVRLQHELEEVREFGCKVGDIVRYDAGSGCDQ